MSEIDGNILFGMLGLTFAFWMYSFATSFMRVRNIILQRESDTTWLNEQLDREGVR